MVEMICQEIALRNNYLTEKNISTVYFGGGTPSLMEAAELELIMSALREHYNIDSSAEITLEANPDDLTKEKLLMFKNYGINRLSIGIQSFDNKQLSYMNRAHQSEQASNSVKLAQDIGFDNISIDLIYGIPSPDHTIWESDLAQALALNIQHISSYCLTIEPSTVFGRRKEKGILAAENEEYNAQQFERLIERLETNGFEQYEVSNFCKPGFFSKHNTSYWNNKNYLGIGPGAHSYDGKSRQFNIENNIQYISSLAKEMIPFTTEVLDAKTKANEYIMTGLRTKWGIDTITLEGKFGIPFDNYKKMVEKYQKMGFLVYEKSTLKLTKKGLLFADKITEDLFII
jgi:oxygen-independent coproporphyrinogen-3 oxidase